MIAPSEHRLEDLSLCYQIISHTLGYTSRHGMELFSLAFLPHQVLMKRGVTCVTLLTQGNGFSFIPNKCILLCSKVILGHLKSFKPSFI